MAVYSFWLCQIIKSRYNNYDLLIVWYPYMMLVCLFLVMITWHKQDISVPHGPLTIESHPIYTPSGLSQGTYQTNEHNHFKEIRDWVCGNNYLNI